MAEQGTTKHTRRKLWLIPLCLILALAVGSAWYLGTYYHADVTAEEALSSPPAGVVTELIGSDDIVFLPEGDPEAGLIFYPGGKVEYTAYAPLLDRLAEDGILCILVRMPCSLAIMNIDAADGLTELYPEVERWYIGGHSLGGVCAGMYLESHADEYDGLILLGAYTNKDLSASGLRVLSLYGENDGVLDRESYAENRVNLPEDFTEYVIPGGCHAWFGSYGEQKGDGAAAITPEEQWNITAEEITEWIGNG